MKNPDWNSAFLGNEDNNALMSSEVFCNYLKAELSKQDEEDKEDDPEASKVPQPLMRNKDYVKAQAEDEAILMALAQAEDEVIAEIDLEGDSEIDEKLLGELDDELDEAEAEAGASNFELNDGNPYETTAGESKFIEIGLSNETARELEDGIDYADDEPYFNARQDSTSDNSPEIVENVKEVMAVYHNEELIKAEKALGLNYNVAYQLSKLGK